MDIEIRVSPGVHPNLKISLRIDLFEDPVLVRWNVLLQASRRAAC